MRAIPLRVLRALPRFVPLSARELARARPGTVAFLGDMRWEPCRAGSTGQLVCALGSAVAGRVDAVETVTPAATTARAVRPDGTVLEVSVEVLPPRPEQPAARVEGAFVYGTLMRGEEREAAIRRVLPSVTPVDGWVTGGLVHLGTWPGLVSGDGDVHGELFLAPELGTLLAELDPIEDFAGFQAPPTEYVRVVLPVFTPRGRVWAWAYRYVGDLSRAVPIPSGRWRDAPRRLGHAHGS